MRVRSNTCPILITLVLWCSAIKALPPGTDVDASIAKLINAHTITLPTPPLGSLNVPPVGQGSDASRQSGGHGLFHQQIPPLQAKPSSPSLNLVNGTVIGRRLAFGNLEGLPSIVTNECHAFLGVPFAAPPVDDLRFKAPRPPSRWPGSLEATKYKSACTQDPRSLPKGWSISEDCLHVNIFKAAVSSPVAIVVWVHGGGFLSGSATTLSPTTACRQVVVNTLTVVTVNYRLGPFGFLAHENLSTNDTNLGLRDVAQAIKWVQDNAEALGGQSDQIVLAGHGAGAALVSHLLDSNLIDLTTIKGAILMSGSSLAPWAITRHSWRSASRLMNETSCSTLECLRTTGSSSIMERSPRLWSPYVDNVAITASDTKKMDSKRFEDQFPVIMGFTLQEGTALAVQKLATANGQPLKEKITRSLVDLTGESKEVVERRYLYDRTMPIDFFETIFDFIDALSEAYSDTLFKLPSIREATARTQQQASNVYVYAIRHDVPLPGNSLPGYKASYHGSDLDLFWSPYAKQTKINLLGAFLHVIMHQDDELPWRPWSPQSPMVLHVTPYGGQVIAFRPPDPIFRNQSFYNTTAKYGNAAVAWTINPPKKFTLVNANSTPFPILFGKKKIPSASPPPPSSSPSPTPATTTTSTATDRTTTASVNVTSVVQPLNLTANSTNSTADFVPPRDTTLSPLNTTFATSTKSPPSNRSNSSTSENGVPPSTGQQDSLVWVLLGLAVLFLFLFLITVGGCAAWNRQSYHPHPNRRSRHQGAKVRGAQARVPPPVAPLESSSSGSSHQPPSHAPRGQKNSEGKTSGRRMVHQSSASANISGGHRRPRQPPPSLPPLLGKELKRN